MPFIRTFIKMFLEECLMCFKMYEGGKKYICFVRCGICNMYGYFVRNVFVKYMEVWEILRLNIVNTWAYSCCWNGFCVMSWVMLLFKKGDFVREVEKDMEMCLWVAKWWCFRIVECGRDG